MAFCQDIAYKELKPSGASIPLKDCISQDIAYKELKRDALEPNTLQCR